MLNSSLLLPIAGRAHPHLHVNVVPVVSLAESHYRSSPSLAPLSPATRHCEDRSHTNVEMRESAPCHPRSAPTFAHCWMRYGSPAAHIFLLRAAMCLLTYIMCGAFLFFRFSIISILCPGRPATGNIIMELSRLLNSTDGSRPLHTIRSRHIMWLRGIGQNR
jgi:hypothetical protein